MTYADKSMNEAVEISPREADPALWQSVFLAALTGCASSLGMGETSASDLVEDAASIADEAVMWVTP